MNTAYIFIGSTKKETRSWVETINPYTKEACSRHPLCDISDVQEALKCANNAKKDAAAVLLSKRTAWMQDVADRLESEKSRFSKLITQETGKPMQFAMAEVQRCIETIRLSAHAALQLHGETIPTDATPSGKETTAFFMRVPSGVIVAITPFNYPLNLVAHKLAPALATGNTVVLKPTPEAPACAYELAKLFIESPLASKDALSIVYGDREVGEALVTSDIPRVISFTGSEAVGRIITKTAGIKKISLELGGNAAAYVDKDADPALSAARCALGAFLNSGQVCISLQRLYVHKEIYESFSAHFVREVASLKTGDPFDHETFIGPMINNDALNRARLWIWEAKKEGAKVLCGDEIFGGCLKPTVLSDVTSDMKVVCEEVFAPIVSLIKVSNDEEAFRLMNDSRYGLQHAVFTNNLSLALRATRELSCGGVVINDMPTLRFDIQPYGGIGFSGIGKEGPRYAAEEFTEIKTVVFA